MFHKLPSEVLEEDASLLRLLRIRALGAPEENGEEDADQWPTS